jgi:FAD/FMN-containing dehydrogenase
VSTVDIDALRTRIRGSVIQPGDADYDSARRVYNGMIDKRPAAIVRCTDVADVVAAVHVAGETGILTAIRGGGHNGGGFGTCDDGLVIDLSRMKGVRVDPAARTVRVEPGCTGGDLDHGLAIDNLLEIDVVLADGRFVTASDKENPDLFWAVRGGGGNFGVVTSFLFRLHPVTTVVAGPTFWPIEQAPQVMPAYEDFILKAPEDINGFLAFLTVPAVPLFPPEIHGKKVCAIIWCSTASPERAEQITKPMRSVGTPLLDHVGPMPFPTVQSLFDPLLPSGMQWYWRADFVKTFNADAIQAHYREALKTPAGLSQVHIYPIDGAAHRVGREDTAFSYRDANFAVVIVGIDPDPARKDAITQWCKGYFDAVHPYSAGGAYVNFMMDEGQERVQASFRDNYARLARIKAKFDPSNLFRVNQNIRPTSSAT